MDKKDLYLVSDTGFMMPFVPDKECESTLLYGDQIHPVTGKMFHHSGIDFVCNHLPLYAIASGTVIGVGKDEVHGEFIRCRFGNFEVKYGHVSQVNVSYGASVVAGQQIGVSGDFLHWGVTVLGEELDPAELMGILYTNISQLYAMGMDSYLPIVDFDVDVKTRYDKDGDEIITMMLRYLPEYLNEVTNGQYIPSEYVENNLRHLYAQSAQKGLFFENIPTMANPVGLGAGSSQLVSKVQEILIGDFLNYMSLRHGMTPSSWTPEEKKNLLKNFAPRK